jgi:hypothetical protein
MDIVETSRGFAVVDDDGQVVSLHKSREQALARMNQLEYAEGGASPNTASAFKRQAQVAPSVSGPGMKIQAPPGAKVEPGPPPPAPRPAPATVMPTMRWPGSAYTADAVARADQGPPAANAAMMNQEAARAGEPATLGTPAPQARIYTTKRGKDHVLMEGDKEVGRFKDEDVALEHANLLKYHRANAGSAEDPERFERNALMQSELAQRGAISQATGYSVPMTPQPRLDQYGNPIEMSGLNGQAAWDEPRTRRLADPNWVPGGDEEEEEPPPGVAYARGQGLVRKGAE